MYLVGAGPGDPELITRKGQELLLQADVVVYDRLVAPELLTHTRTGCERIYAGKEADEKGAGQKKIHRLLIRKAKAGYKVIRLKGGDPTVFGRISEELEALKKAGIAFEVIPGVSSVWAAAAAAGIPLTDRRTSSSVAIVAGHQAADKGTLVRWEQLSRAVDTLVILMGWARLPEIVKKLLKVWPASTPIAVLRWVSTPAQERVISTLGRVESDLKKRPDFGPPVVAIVGEVVRLARAQEVRPLKEKTVIVTRPAGDQEGLTRRLAGLGAACRHLPTIAIRHKKIPAAQARKLVQELPRYDWILFTSHHGVESLERLARGNGKRLASLVKGKICAIGPRTAQSVRAAGLTPDLLPDEFSKEGIERTFDRIPVKGKRILIPRSNLGMGDKLAKVLCKRAALVREAVLYETLPIRIPPARIKKALREADAVTFTSASTARVFLESLSAAKLPVRSAFNGTAVVAIGPATGNELKARGVKQVVMPRRSWTIDGLVEAVVEVVG